MTRKAFPTFIIFLVGSAALLGLLAGCGSTPPARLVDPELSRLSGAARRAFDRGEIAGASRLYRQGLRRARAMDDTVEIARLTYNLGLCLVVLEHYDEALEYLEEARAEFSREGDIPVDLEVLEAKLALRQGKLAEAEARAGEGLARRGSSISPSDSLQFVLIAAQIDLARNELQPARKKLEEARELFQSLSRPESMLEARLSGLEGELFSADGEFNRAGEAFDRQVDLLQEAAKYREMALALSRAGEAFGKADKPGESSDRFYRAARSLFAQGDNLTSMKIIERALAASEESGEEELRRKTVDLFEEIKQSVE